MDFRRTYGFRAPRPIRESTFMMPQLENYSLFANPFLDLNKKIQKIVGGMEKDKTKPETDEKRLTRQGRLEEEKLKKEASKEKLKEGEGKKTPAKETSDVEVNFGIVLNVATLTLKELTITFEEGNEIKVSVKQTNCALDQPDAVFSRDCSYTYELPDDVPKNSLAALWTEDDYLIILQKDLLRMDLFNESRDDKKELAESSDKDAAKSADPEEKPAKPKSSPTKRGRKVTPKGKKEPPKPEIAFSDEDGLKPMKVTRMLRPGMDVFMLRKYIGDLESYVSTVRKFIENASFVMGNSKTAERRLRQKVWNQIGAYNEDDVSITPLNKRKRLPRGESPPEKVYSIAEHHIKSLLEVSDDSRGSSSMSAPEVSKTPSKGTPEYSEESR